MKIEEIKKVLSEFSLFRELMILNYPKLQTLRLSGNGKSKAMFFSKVTHLKMFILFMMEK